MEPARLKELIKDYRLTKRRLELLVAPQRSMLQSQRFQAKGKGAAVKMDPTLDRVIERDAYRRKRERLEMKLAVVDAFLAHVKRKRAREARELYKYIEASIDGMSMSRYCEQNGIPKTRISRTFNEHLIEYCWNKAKDIAI